MEVLLFPINVVPDIVSNTLLYATTPIWMNCVGEPGNLWPVVWLGSPVFGPLCGIMDAWHGYPFWNPVALDEHRLYGEDGK